jgi:hypothetical protein
MKRLLFLTAILCIVGVPTMAQVSSGTSNSVNLGPLLKKAYEKKATVVQTAAVTTPVAVEKAVDEIVLNSDVDTNIPETGVVNNDGIAVVIGNRNYQKTKHVEFAINDSRAVKQYLMKTMGFREGNIFYYEDATKTDFEVLFGTKDFAEGKLYNAVKPGKSDVFVFYAGHGAPDLRKNTGYFVPVECDPQYIAISGYSSDVFFNNISQIPSKSTTVVMDACFSGADILEGVSPIGIKSKSFDNVQNGVMLSSSAGTQVSSWYTEKNHGMFTYFFLKAMQDANADYDGDGQLTAREVYQYVSDKADGVPYYARRYRSIEQTPTIQGDIQDNVLVSFKPASEGGEE